jgi:Rha family phage regulatory protein
VTNSLLVAEKFGKEHRHVLDSIRSILTAENPAVLSMFVESTYLNLQNKEQPMYIMNRDGFTLLAMGFTGKDALKFKMDFINAFNKMEVLLNSDEYIIMRGMRILDKKAKELEAQVHQQQEIIEIKDRKIVELLPDAEYTKQVLLSKDTFTTTQIAKEHGMSAETLNKKLHEWGIQYKQNKQWILYAKHQDKDYTKTNTYSETHNGETRTYHSTVWTEKGRRFIKDLLREKQSA